MDQHSFPDSLNKDPSPPGMRVVLITGCSSGGIGHALCERFALDGCKVYATARRLESIDLYHPRIEKLALDVTKDEDVHRVVTHIVMVEGRIDIVINNAGMMAIGPLIDQSLEFTHDVFNTNVYSVLRVCKAVVPIMAKRKRGIIVNVGSVVGEIPTPWNGLYSASKAALHSLTEVLSMECKPFNISVVLVSPGAVQSNIAKNQASRFDLPSESLYTDYLPNIIARMHASQGPDRMPTEVFAKQIVRNVLQPKPPSYLMLGGKATIFWMLKWLPRPWVLWLMWRLHSKRLS